MVQHTRTITVTATPIQVFDTLADREQAKAWIPEIQKVDPVGDAAMGVGATWIETRKSKRGLVVSRVEVTDFKAGESFGLKATSKAFVVNATYGLKAAGASTEVTFSATVKGKGLMGLLSAGRIAKEVDAEAQPMLERLKAHVESRTKVVEPVLTEKKAKPAKAAKAAPKVVAAAPKKAAKAPAKVAKAKGKR